MKKLLYIAAVLALCAACSAAEEGGKPEKMVEWTFNALYTKAAISVPGGVFSWEAGDRVDVWDRSSGSFVPFTTVTGTGRFRATAPESCDFGDAAFYPSGAAVSTSEVQLPSAYEDQAEALRAFPMFAPVDKESSVLSFKHLGAIATLNFASVQPESGTVTISVAGKSISGSFGIQDSEGTKFILAAEGSGSVSIPFTMELPGSFSVTVPLPTGTYALSVTVGSQGTFEIPENTFERANLYRFATIYVDGIEPVLDSAGTEVFSLEDDSQNWI